MGNLLHCCRSLWEHTEQTPKPSSTLSAQISTPEAQSFTPDAQLYTHVEQSTPTHASVLKSCKAEHSQEPPTPDSTVGFTSGESASYPRIVVTPKSTPPPGRSAAGSSLKIPKSSLPTSASAAGSTSSASVSGGNPCLPQTSGGLLTTDDENVLKYFVMLRRTGPAATTVAKVCRRLYGGGQLSVKDFCTDNLGFTNAQYNKIFTRHEREAFECVDWEQLDITCVYKLLQRVCGLASPSDALWTNPEPQHAESLEHILFSIKGERNFLAHEAVVLTEDGLLTRSQKLESLLEKALEKASCITGEDYAQDINEMKTTIDDIRKSKTKLFLHNYQRELQEFLHELVNKIIINSQTELRQAYQKLWESERIWWHFGQGFQSPQLEKIFTEITVITKNNSVVPVLQILDYKLRDGSLPRLVVLEGIAGMGKSQICKYILKCWASRGSDVYFFLNFDIIIFIQCHSVSSSSLSEYLREEILKETCKGIKHEDVIRTLRECHILFIIDGIDEAGKHAKFIVQEVSAKFPASRVVVTCRPEYTEEAKRIISPSGNNFTVLYVKGFSKTQQKEYINKLLIVMEENTIKREKMVKTFLNDLQTLEHEIYSLLSLPLTMMLLTLLWLQDNTSFTGVVTVTHILQQSVEMNIKRLVQRINQKPEETRHILLIERACREWLLCLARVAWESLIRNTQTLDDDNYSWILDLLAEAQRHDIDPIDAMSSFLICTTREHAVRIQHIWEFPHKAYQEYLAGFHLSEVSLSLYRTSYSFRGTLRPSSSSISKQTELIGKEDNVSLVVNRYKYPLPKARITNSYSGSEHHFYLSAGESEYEYALPRNCTIQLQSSLNPFYKGGGECQCKLTRREMRRSSDVSRDTRRSSDVSREMRRSSDVSRDTRRSSDVSRDTRRSSDVSRDTRRSSEVSREMRRSSDVSRDTRRSSEVSREMRRSSDVSRDTRRSSDVSRDTRRSSDASIETRSSSDACRLARSKSIILVRSSDASRDTRRSSVASRDTRRSSDVSEDPYAVYEIMGNSSFDTNTLNQALLFSMAIEVSKQDCNKQKIASIVEKIDKNVMFNTWVGWSNIIRECAENEVVCRLIQPYLQKHRTIQLSGYQISQTLPAIKYLMQTTGFVPESLSISLSNDDVFPDVFPSLVASLGTLSVYTNINCFLHHCLDLLHCLIKQETLDYVNITVHGNSFGELSGFAHLLQYLHGRNSKLNLNLTVNDTQSSENIAQCFANTTVPRDAELLLFFTCFTPMMHQPLCEIFKAFPWQRPLSIAFSHTDLCSYAPHLLKLISRALIDARVKISHVSLVMEACAKSSAAIYEELAYVIAGKAPLDAARKAPLDGAGKAPLDAAGKAAVDAAGKAALDAAGKAALDAAGKGPLNGTGKAPLDAEGKAPHDAAGKAPLDGAGKAPLDAAGKASLDAEGKAPLDGAGKASLDAEGKAPLDGAGKAPLDAAGKAPLDGAGKASLDAEGKAPLDGAGKAPLDAAGKAPLDAAGKAPLDGAGKAPLDGAGKAPLDAAGKAPLDGAGKASLDAEGKAPLDGAGKASLDAEGKAPLDGAGKAPLDAAGKAPLDAEGNVLLDLNTREGTFGDHVTFTLQGTKCGLE